MDIDKVLEQIKEVRRYQDEKWGGPAHDDGHTGFEWVEFIEKQVQGSVNPSSVNFVVFREQMVRVAALAVAAIQWADRNAPANCGGGSQQQTTAAGV